MDLLQKFEKFFESEKFYDLYRLLNIEFDLENTYWKTDEGGFHGFPYDELLGLQNISGQDFLGLQAGGDWEYPVYFVYYERDEKAYLYVPVRGNMYNHSANTAYSEEEGENNDNLLNLDEIRKDIAEFFLK